MSTQKKEILEAFVKYLEENGKETNTYWRIRHFLEKRDFEYSNVLFKGDSLLATLKAYNYIKTQKGAEYLDTNIVEDVLDVMEEEECSIEEAVKLYVNGLEEEDDDGNVIKPDFGGPFGNGNDTLWLEKINGELKIFLDNL